MINSTATILLPQAGAPISVSDPSLIPDGEAIDELKPSGLGVEELVPHGQSIEEQD